MSCPTLHTSVHVNFIKAHKTLTQTIGLVFVFFVPPCLHLSLSLSQRSELRSLLS
jgi:hypothetical protein